MIYCIARADAPLICGGCGNLISDGGFLHPRRNMGDFVFIKVLEGTLCITQGETDWEAGPDSFVLLRPFTLHFGSRQSNGRLSYYWVHFRLPDCAFSESVPQNLPPDRYVLPEYGKLSGNGRVQLLFGQLLDIAKRQDYACIWRQRYALAGLLLETAAEYMGQMTPSPELPPRFCEMLEWIRSHYDQDLTVQALAEQFHYHPTYLAGLFRKYTGQPVLAFLNRTRIEVAQRLLTESGQPVYLTALSVGFRDEKYFMRQFKKYVGMTPTQYRTAFHQKRLNTR